MEHLHTTICALATPPGEGGIATVRVSGPDAYGIVGKLVGHCVDTGHSLETLPLEEYKKVSEYFEEDV